MDLIPSWRPRRSEGRCGERGRNDVCDLMKHWEMKINTQQRKRKAELSSFLHCGERSREALLLFCFHDCV
jgi:hypothetical protein